MLPARAPLQSRSPSSRSNLPRPTIPLLPVLYPEIVERAYAPNPTTCDSSWLRTNPKAFSLSPRTACWFMCCMSLHPCVGPTSTIRRARLLPLAGCLLKIGVLFCAPFATPLSKAGPPESVCPEPVRTPPTLWGGT